LDNNEIMAWSVAVAALAFVVLCGFLISLLRTAQRSLITAQSALQEVKQTIEGLQGEVQKLAGSVNEVASNVKGKLQSTDPLFDAVQDVGIMLSEVTGTAREAAKTLTNSIRKQAAASERGYETPNWLRWAALGSRLAASFRNGREREERSAHSDMKERI
jgi:uncharacterized protein YoxC